MVDPDLLPLWIMAYGMLVFVYSSFLRVHDGMLCYAVSATNTSETEQVLIWRRGGENSLDQAER